MTPKPSLKLALLALAAAILTACGKTEPPPQYPTKDRVAADRRAIGIPYDRFVLFRRDEQMVALRVTRASQIGDSIDYQWFASRPEAVDLTDPITGEGKTRESGYMGRIAAGSMVLQWSRGSEQFGWLYWPDDRSEFAVCSLAWGSLEEADRGARGVRWYTRDQFQ
ncbi:MAG: hypothetical protein ACC742_12075 [Thermoanaerobaculales bacterium]